MSDNKRVLGVVLLVLLACSVDSLLIMVGL